MRTRQRYRQPESEAEAETQTRPEDTSIEVEAVRQPRVRAPPAEVEFAEEGLGLGFGQEFAFGPEAALGTEFGAEFGTETFQEPGVDTRVVPELGFESMLGAEQTLGLEPAVETRQDFRQEYRQEYEQRVETRIEAQEGRLETEGRDFPDEDPFGIPGLTSRLLEHRRRNSSTTPSRGSTSSRGSSP